MLRHPLNILAFALLLFLASTASGQQEGVRIMQRVDTAHPHVREVLQRWVDSLHHWRGDVGDISQNSGFFTSTGSIVRDWFSQDNDVVMQFPATVMSVEYDGGGWVVRTIFARLDATSRIVIPLGIIRARFVLAADASGMIGWQLEDALKKATALWDTTRVDGISYIHPRDIGVDEDRAKESPIFCKAIAERFGLQAPASIQVILTHDRDELCRILGLEYYAFPPQALSFPEAHLIIEAGNETYHPHELAHIVFKDFDGAHPILREGLATLLGGTGVMDFSDALAEYLEAHSNARIPSFVELFTGVHIDQSDEYVLGAVICDLVLRYHGRAALLELLRNQRPSDVMIALSTLLGFDIADRQESLRSMAEAAYSRGVTGR
ncbi:MAG TPA: hypothetical protein VK147_04560 [Candidatus Didemnitutus sp.]|nr:hypothetical protein [Candidatus Didemnitutus sp.]